MKKRIALLLAGAMLATLTMAGCGSKEEAPAEVAAEGENK